MHTLQQNDKFLDLKKQYLLTFGKVKKICRKYSYNSHTGKESYTSHTDVR